MPAPKAIYGGKSGKTTDDMLDTIAELVRERTAAHDLIVAACISDPSLFPILSEIDAHLQPVKKA